MHTVFAAALREGDWFWHEPWPGHRSALLQAAEVLVTDTTVQISTTDGKRELVNYRHDRLIELASQHEFQITEPSSEDNPTRHASIT